MTILPGVELLRRRVRPLLLTSTLCLAAIFALGCSRADLDLASAGELCGGAAAACSAPSPDAGGANPPPALLDAGGGADADAGAQDDSAPEAGPVVTLRDAGPASCLAVDPARDNTVPDAVVASPLTPVWTASFAGPISYPIVAGKRVLVAAEEAEADLQAFDLEAGARLWGPILFGSSPLIAAEGDTIFALEPGGNLSALDAADGHLLWNVQLPGEPSYWYAPVASGGVVYVDGGGEGTATFGIDEATGATLWTAHLLGGGNIAVAGNVAYQDDGCQAVYAIDVLEGTVDWFHQGTCSGAGRVLPSAAAYGGFFWVFDPLAFGTNGIILDSTGKPSGTFNATDTLALHAGTVFYPTTQLTAVDIQTQVAKWSFTGDGSLCGAPVVAGGSGQVFMASSSGNVYELDEASGTQRSVHHLDPPPSCNGGGAGGVTALGLASDHLLVPANNTLVVY